MAKYVKTEDGYKLIAELVDIRQSDWGQKDITSIDYIKNRTHGDYITDVFWDGDISGRKSASIEYGNYYYFVTDIVPDIEKVLDANGAIVEIKSSLIGCSIDKIKNGITTTINTTEITEPYDGIYITDSNLMIFKEAGTYKKGNGFLVIQQPGIYALLESGLTSFKFSFNYTKTLDKKYLPDNVYTKNTTIILPATNWTGDTNLYSQKVTINGITANSKIDLQPTAEQLLELQGDEITLMIANDNGVTTAYAMNNKPTKDYEMQVLITETVSV